jgi:hypothetical protein
MILLPSVDSMTASLIFSLTTASFASKFCQARLNANTVLDIAFKIANSIHEKSLQRRLFNLTLEEGSPDIILHTAE